MRVITSPATSEEGLLNDIAGELKLLAEATPDPEHGATTMVVARPPLLDDFDDYNDMAGIVNDVIDDLGLRGVVQLATFHPRYLFAGESEVLSYTNRSPYATFHLLLEDEITQAVAAYPDIDKIWMRNQATVQRVGADAMQSLLHSCRQAASQGGGAEGGASSGGSAGSRH
ncbi:hypothetical protein JKP88DRAFT_222644 [Tribonema minus]|uniref:Uncharacterized protein n=1 Tax=Tribonema minus TaxID=303371 RepID=A0A835YVN8_9STRA|nr:hypothetical protein JKP88DRAFT_222644 [Tribonema minus]